MKLLCSFIGPWIVLNNPQPGSLKIREKQPMQWYIVQYALKLQSGSVTCLERRVLADNAPNAKKHVRASLTHLNVKLLMISARKVRGK